MSDIERIENVLRRAPKVRVPAGLAEKLKADITLPRASAAANTADFWAGFRRWFPGFATAALFLTCLVALGVQQRVLSGLRQEQKQLESVAAEAQQVADSKRAAQEQAQAQAAQLAQLRKDNAELQQLRGEVAQLREQLQQLPVLQAEHQRLVAQANAIVSQSNAAASDPFAMAQDKAQRIQCVSNMKQIGLAARMWANDHKDILPVDFLTMQNELNSPKILVCPAETNRPAARTWSEFSGSSYVILSPGIPETRPDVVYAQCPIHNNVGLCDGSVHQLSPNQPVVKDETGHWIVKRRQ
jgi:hypothetical protein